MNEETVNDPTAADGKAPADAQVENGGEPEEVFLQEEAAPAASGADDKLMRLMADFDNFRRRSAKERAQERQRGRRDAAEKLLPVFDSLASGLLSVKPGDPVRAGMEAVFNQLLSSFAQLGIRRIPAKGEAFNPELMEAVARLPHPELEENVVMEETRPGFVDDLGLLRAAQVVVSAGNGG